MNTSPRVSRTICVFGILLGATAFLLRQDTTATQHPYSPDEPVLHPKLFAEGIISTGDHESHLTFTPDGKTVYFLKNSPNFDFWTIVVSRFQDGRWSTPEVAEFSGQYHDADPFITADGSRLFFISTRPLSGVEAKDLDIWVVDREGNHWGTPKNLGQPVNSTGREWHPTIARNGTIYFGSDREGGKGRTDLYRSRYVNGKYVEPENLGDSVNTKFEEFEPYIDPDERFLILMSPRQGGFGGGDLYVSYNRNGEWTTPKNLGDLINSSGTEFCPRFSPDGKYFFWTSTRGSGDKPNAKKLSYSELLQKIHSPVNGLGDIYFIDASVLNLKQGR